jgi:hypothetical protein
MHQMRYRPVAGVAALAAVIIALGQLHTFAFSVKAEAASPAEGFSPLFGKRLEAGVQRMDGPPDLVQVAGLHLYEAEPITTIFSANPVSYCIGSACFKSACLGSACLYSQCFGSACTTSGCMGSLCGGSVCLGSVCLGSACLGSACNNCPDLDDPGEVEL